jgi:hypothetical protein
MCNIFLKIILRGHLKTRLYSGFISREDGIRTHDTVTRILPFQGSLFNHSSTSLDNRIANI